MIKFLPIIFIFSFNMYANSNIKHSTYWIAKSHLIGKNYALLISQKVPDFKQHQNSDLCNKYIIQDIQQNNKYFFSNYLQRNFNKDFTVNVFMSCVNNINKLK